MKCNLPKVKRMSEKDMNRLAETLTNVRCCKCGRVMEVMSLAYATMNFDKNRYENRLCDECRKESGSESMDSRG